MAVRTKDDIMLLKLSESLPGLMDESACDPSAQNAAKLRHVVLKLYESLEGSIFTDAHIILADKLEPLGRQARRVINRLQKKAKWSESAKMMIPLLEGLIERLNPNYVPKFNQHSIMPHRPISTGNPGEYYCDMAGL